MKKTIYGLWYIITGQKKFRVEYPDGKHSVKMTYQVAEGYASIFGGKVCIDLN